MTVIVNVVDALGVSVLSMYVTVALLFPAKTLLICVTVPVIVTVLVPELVIVAPEGDSDEAVSFARSVGARLVTVSGPTEVADALSRALDRV